MKLLTVFSCIFVCCVAQQKGTNTPEEHLPLTIQRCSKGVACQDEHSKIVLDSNWRWTHDVGGYTNCFSGNTWDPKLCPDAASCTKNCALDGVDQDKYKNTYGVSVSGGTELTLKFVTQGPYSKNVGSRLYLLDSSGSRYKLFHLLNQEFTFDVDVSELPCGLNGALYFVQMDEDGGMSKFPTNKCGAAYGTGYCDAQCPHDIKWINGEANSEGWTPSPNDANSGKGKYGSCCAEMDIWEANSQSQAFTTHPCSLNGAQRCEGIECGDNPNHRYDGVCDKDGCDFGSFRVGDHQFFGKGSSFAVDSSKKMTVVTQFHTIDGNSQGHLKEIRRLYVQNGKVVQNSKVNFPGLTAYDSITDSFCNNIKDLFGDHNAHKTHGGLTKMGESLNAGMVLVMSLWDDHDANMLWLDAEYPLDADPKTPGVKRGPCPRDSGTPDDVEAKHPDAKVKFSNVRYGDIGSTF